MGTIDVRKLVRFHKKKLILEEVSLVAPAGEITAILGDHGSGKMTVLRCIAGVERTDSGDVIIDGRDVSGLKAGRRDVAMISHNHSLLPHLNVQTNIAFPLKLAKLAKSDITQRVAHVVARFDLGDILDRRPRTLTEAQCLRVSIARAVVRRPTAYLVEDAPSTVASELKDMIRYEVTQLREEDKATILFATDDGAAAMEIANRLLVLDAGRVIQRGAAQAVYRRPRNMNVANLLGPPTMNRLAAKVGGYSEGVVCLKLRGGTSVSVAVDADEFAKGERVTLGIWPEHLCCGTVGELCATVNVIADTGGGKLLELDSRAGLISAFSGKNEVENVGDEIRVQFPSEHCLLFDSSGSAIAPSTRQERGSGRAID